MTECNIRVYAATRRLRWPGAAAVAVAVVHVTKSSTPIEPVLDGQRVSDITAFLFHRGGNSNPASLLENRKRAFIGAYVLGMGFFFDDGSAKANPIALMHELIHRDNRNAERIFPYMGGEELNSLPDLSPPRYVIDFGQMPEDEARRWPDLMAIVEDKVVPERKDKPGSYSSEWWLFARRNVDGRALMANMKRVLANSLVTAHLGFVFQPTECVIGHTAGIIAHDDYSAFTVVQSRTHEIWARFFGSSLEDRLRYTPTDCFETFPFPEDWQSNELLESAGKTYYEFRAALMIRSDEGLTKTYNRFHDPDEHDQDIVKLRDLHAKMDHAVLTAYGWQDLAERVSCEFQLEYEDAEDDAESEDLSRKKKKKKPWRYKWPQDFHDEVLARLLELNAQRAEQERLAGVSASAGAKKPKRASKKKPSKKKPAKKKTNTASTKQTSAQPSLLPDEDS